MRGPTTQPASIDALQRDVEQVAAGLHHEPEVAHRREPGEQRRARVDRGAQRAEHGVVLHAVHGAAHGRRGVRAAEEEVDLHVHQARQQRHVAEVDLGRRRRHVGRVDRGDAVALDDDDGRRTDLARVDVDPTVGTQDGDVSHGVGSTKQVKYADPLSGTRGLEPHLDGERHVDERVDEVHQVGDGLGHVVERVTVAVVDRGRGARRHRVVERLQLGHRAREARRVALRFGREAPLLGERFEIGELVGQQSSCARLASRAGSRRPSRRRPCAGAATGSPGR